MATFNIWLKTNQPLRYSRTPNINVVVPFLWKKDQNIDSDGDEEGDEKIYQYLQNRDNEQETLTIELNQKGTDFFSYKISSELEHIAARATYILALVTNGEISFDIHKNYSEPSILAENLGKDFNLNEALRRAELFQQEMEKKI